jgi:prolyl-tRNA synthetase
MSCEVINEPDNVIIAKLAELSLSQTTYSHPESFTIEAQAIHVASVPGSLTKNLFLRDKKHGLFLITTRDTQEVNLKVVANLLNLSGANMRFGDAELLNEKLGVIQGCISPFALINDINKDVKFCIDKSLLSEEVVNMHPLRNDRTTSISPANLLSFLDNIDHKPILLDFSAASLPPAPVQKTKAVKAEKVKKEEHKKGETLLGLSATKEGDFSSWYTQVITLSEMIDYSDVSGCYILRPWSFHIWEAIQTYFDGKIKELGVKNAYFPLFVTDKALNTEKDHIEGFAPEVAWVTKSGDKDLPEKLGIRPTSETIIYPFFAKWIRSHRDLPLELNQWSNVVRWEFKDATPFLRSREFLWQEGHTAHQNYEEAQERVLSILDLYESVYEYLLAVPVVKGIKTEQEKFAGAHHTTTVEAYINGSGRAIQGATSHNLGLGFGKMFDISYEDDQGKKNIPWQTSWGLTTRSIGVCVMVHGDNKGLVLPPRVAPVQVIICPIQIKNCDYTELLAYSENVRVTLKKLKVRVDIDARQNYTPGWRFNHWEQKGVPVRIEIGPRDMANKQLRIVRRDNGEKSDMNLDDINTITDLLDVIQNDMLNKARAGRDDKLVQVTEWKDFVPALEKQCLIMTPFCDEKEWEEKVKKMSKEEALNGGEEEETCATSAGAKTLCKPFMQPPLPEGTKCFISGKPATTWVMWGRSY